MANGTLAASQLEMLSQSGTGITTIVPPATNTDRTITLPDSTGVVATLGTALTLATSVTASGTAVDFTGIPSWVKRITVMVDGLSLNGANNILIQLGYGDTPTFETTGYSCSGTIASTTTISTSTNANGPQIYLANAGRAASGQCIISNIKNDTWSFDGSFSISVLNGLSMTSGSKTISGGALTAVRLVSANGTDTFDAGTISIMYEG